MAQDAAVTGRGSGGADHDAPTLSVVIACLNAADTLGLQLEALADQSCPVRWELLLCDNGSTDASLAVAESFRDRLPGLRVVDATAHRGAGPARNYGVQVARGEWVAFCDADDEVAPGWLAAISRAMTDHRFVAGRFEAARLNSARVLRSRPLQQDHELQTSYFGPDLPHAGAGNLAARRADFLRVGGFDPQIPLLEDTDLCWRMQLAGVPLVLAPDAVVHVRLRATLSGMYRQGHGYGRACAMLEERYGRGQAESEAEPAGEPAAAGVPGRTAAAARWLVNHLIGGQLFWRAGWVVGHRRYRTGVLGPAPRPLPSKVA
jgi:cellulose synthase/poly-beta-1,6-N-acetylglucosamine synthase-like glycosyltransferase